MKYKNIYGVLEDIIGSALNDNSKTVGVSREGEPMGPECVKEDNFDTVVKQAITNIIQSDYINIKFKE